MSGAKPTPHERARARYLRLRRKHPRLPLPGAVLVRVGSPRDTPFRQGAQYVLRDAWMDLPRHDDRPWLVFEGVSGAWVANGFALDGEREPIWPPEERANPSKSSKG